MIQEETELFVADNSGAKKVKCIRVLGGTGRRYAKVGDIIVCSVKVADPHGNIKKGEKVKAVVVRTKYKISREDGTFINFYDNSCVILGDKENPRGSRIFGPIAQEIRKKGFLKIASLAIELR